MYSHIVGFLPRWFSRMPISSTQPVKSPSAAP
jgi:hypothetical protein